MTSILPALLVHKFASSYTLIKFLITHLKYPVIWVQFKKAAEVKWEIDTEKLCFVSIKQWLLSTEWNFQFLEERKKDFLHYYTS